MSGNVALSFFFGLLRVCSWTSAASAQKSDKETTPDQLRSLEQNLQFYSSFSGNIDFFFKFTFHTIHNSVNNQKEWNKCKQFPQCITDKDISGCLQTQFGERTDLFTMYIQCIFTITFRLTCLRICTSETADLLFARQKKETALKNEHPTLTLFTAD